MIPYLRLFLLIVWCNSKIIQIIKVEVRITNNVVIGNNIQNHDHVIKPKILPRMIPPYTIVNILVPPAADDDTYVAIGLP